MHSENQEKQNFRNPSSPCVILFGAFGAEPSNPIFRISLCSMHKRANSIKPLVSIKVNVCILTK